MLLELEKMTAEQKLGMVFCARRFTDVNSDDTEFTIEMIRKRAIGCVQFPAHKKDIIEKVLAEADYPILVFNDTESGFPTSDLPKIPLMSLAACNDPSYYRAFARCIAREAKQAGYNGTWGPVLDLLHVDGPCKVSRVLSSDPKFVSEAAAVIAEVYRDHHYLSTGKHYPGGEDFAMDTHMAEGFSSFSEEDLEKDSLVPYLDLMERGLLPCIMTGHRVYRKIDPEYPASLSKKVIDIIRRKGFDGLCFTDSFAMMAILQKYGEENVYGMAIEAGNDIVLPNYRTPTREAFGMLMQNYRDGKISETRLDEAVRRVLAAQRFVAEGAQTLPDVDPADVRTLYAIAKDCVTAVTDPGVSATLPNPQKPRLFVVLADNSFDPHVHTPEIGFETWYYPDRIAAKIKEEFPTSEVVFLPEFSNAIDNEKVLLAATAHDEVVFITYCTTSAYLGTDGLTRRTEAVANCLISSDKVVALLHFGNPYALKTLDHVKRRIFGYMIPESQGYAIEVLSGKTEAKGRLPFDVELK